MKERRITGGRRHEAQGFTLIELLTVISLIVILMGMILGAGVYARGAALRARARADIEKIHKALQEYQMQYKKFSPTSAGWKGYPFPSVPGTDATALRNTAVTNWLPADFGFVDPWKNPYQYLYNTNSPNTYTLYSFGPNKDTREDDIYSGR